MASGAQNSSDFTTDKNIMSFCSYVLQDLLLVEGNQVIWHSLLHNPFIDSSVLCALVWNSLSWPVYNFHNYFSILQANIHTSTFIFSLILFSVYSCLTAGFANLNFFACNAFTNKTNNTLIYFVLLFLIEVQGAFLGWRTKRTHKVVAGGIYNFKPEASLPGPLDRTVSITLCQLPRGEWWGLPTV